MSELDKEQTGATADEAQDNETHDDEIDLTSMPTEAQILKKMMRCFLEMFSIDKGNLIMNMMTDSNWGEQNTIWTYIYKDMPQRKFDTASSIFTFVDKKMKDTDWTEENTDV